MPRRARGPVSRGQAAFEALLASDGEGEGAAPRRGARPSRPPKDRERFFRLRADAATGAGVGPPSRRDETPLDALAASFPSVDRALLADCLGAAGGTLNGAVEALATLGIVEAGGGEARRPLPTSAAADAVAVAAGPWSFLVPDVQRLIWALLPQRDAARAAGACREFAARAREGRAAVRTLRPPRGVPPAAVGAMVVAHPKATGLDLAKWGGGGEGGAGDGLRAALAAAAAGEATRRSPLRSLVLPRGAEGDERALADALVALTGLTRLAAPGWARLGDGAARALAAYQRAPEDGLDDVAGSSDSDAMPRAAGGTAALLVAAGVAAAASRAAQRRPCVAPAPGLAAIELTGATALTDAGAIRLLRGGPGGASVRPPCVAAVDLSRCPALTDAAFRRFAPTLRTLTAAHCAGLVRLTLDAGGGPRLASLDVGRCARLEAVTLALPHLEALNVSGCGALASLDVACPALVEVNAAQCPNLSSLWPPRSAPALARLNVFGCRALPSAALEPALEGCDALSSLVVAGALSLARLRAPSPLLARLDVAGCRQLVEVVAPSPQLRAFNAAGCVSLARLALGAASLDALALDGTGRLPVEVAARVRSLAGRGAGG